MAANTGRIFLDRRLHDAAKNGDMPVLEAFLSGTIQVEGEIAVRVTGEGETPPQRPRPQASCLSGVTHGGDTALHIAAHFGQIEVAERICCDNVYLLLQDNANKETPLHYAAKSGKHELVVHFIQRAREVPNHIDLASKISRQTNKDGETALYQAVLYGHQAVVEEFISFSQLASIPNNKKISPLYLAIFQSQRAIVTSLIGSLREDVSPEAYAGPDGQTALHIAAQRIGFVQEVLDSRPELANSIDNSGSTPLHFAAAYGNLAAINTILQNNITCAYVADSSGLYPVHLAVKMGFAEVVAKLFDHCPDLDQLLDNNGRNFVHLAVEDKQEYIVRWICRQPEVAKAMNAQDNNGDTAMHLAVKAGHINVFARLLETKKAHLCATNKDGLTPLDLAISKRRVGFGNWQNADFQMIQTLEMIRCCWGIKRRDHFVSEYRQQLDQKMEKIEENFESTAKNMAIGTGLIASATFAGAFSVSVAYKADFLAGHKPPGLSFAFNSFIILVVYTFGCSITATYLLIQAALTFLEPIYRMNYIMMCQNIIMMATEGFVASFALGLYVILTPVSKGLRYVCLASAVVPVLIQPHLYPNFLITRALVRYLGFKRGFILGFPSPFVGNIAFGMCVLLVFLGALLPSDYQLVLLSAIVTFCSIVIQIRYLAGLFQ